MKSDKITDEDRDQLFSDIDALDTKTVQNMASLVKSIKGMSDKQMRNLLKKKISEGQEGQQHKKIEKLNEKSKKSKYKIDYGTPEHKAKIEKIINDKFPGLTPDGLTHAMGAPKGAKVEFRLYNDGEDEFPMIDFSGDGYEATRSIEYYEGPEPYIYNASLDIDKDSKVRGFDVLKQQIDNASALGMSKMKTLAAGKELNESFVGDVVWPKFGYNADLTGESNWTNDGHGNYSSKTLYELVPEDIRSQMEGTSLQDLYAAPGGKEFWEKELHRSINLDFDLNPDSQSMKVFNDYAARKQSEKSAKAAKSPKGVSAGKEPEKEAGTVGADTSADKGVGSGGEPANGGVDHEPKKKEPDPVVEKPKVNIDYKHKDANHPVAKAIAEDVEHGRKVEAYLKDIESSKLKIEEGRRSQDQIDEEFDTINQQARELVRNTNISKDAKNLSKQQLQAKQKELKERYEKVEKEIEQVKKASREAFLKHFGHENPKPIKHKVTTSQKELPEGSESLAKPLPRMNESQKKALDTASDFISKLTRNTDGIEVGVATSTMKSGTPGVTRAFAWGPAKQIFMSEGEGRGDEYDDQRTVIHEMGHILEHNIPGLKNKMREFIDYRVDFNQDRKIKDVVKELYGEDSASGYKDDEMGNQDDFQKIFGDSKHEKILSYYVGKTYPDGQTELLAMMMEQLYYSPGKLAQKDPELFHYITKSLAGG